MDYQINLQPTLFKDRLPEKSILSIQQLSGITYPTYLSMTNGLWNVRMLDTLTKYLISIGITKADLESAKFTDIFSIK
ncbi:MAG: hypothetical protein WC341_00470 [Bacteroidales bacterium]|jgi:hypothetical protein